MLKSIISLPNIVAQKMRKARKTGRKCPAVTKCLRLILLPAAFHAARLNDGRLGILDLPGQRLLFFLFHVLPPRIQDAQKDGNYADCIFSRIIGVGAAIGRPPKMAYFRISRREMFMNFLREWHFALQNARTSDARPYRHQP